MMTVIPASDDQNLYERRSDCHNIFFSKFQSNLGSPSLSQPRHPTTNHLSHIVRFCRQSHIQFQCFNLFHCCWSIACNPWPYRMFSTLHRQVWISLYHGLQPADKEMMDDILSVLRDGQPIDSVVVEDACRERTETGHAWYACHKMPPHLIRSYNRIRKAKSGSDKPNATARRTLYPLIYLLYNHIDRFYRSKFGTIVSERSGQIDNRHSVRPFPLRKRFVTVIMMSC